MAMFAQGEIVIANADIWHKQIRGINPKRLKIMQTHKIATWLPNFKLSNTQKVYEACQFGKQSKASFPYDKHVSKDVLEIVHFDVWGPAKTTSIGGCRFSITFIDDHTRKVWVYFMKEE